MKNTSQANANRGSHTGLQLNLHDWQKLKLPLILLSVVLVAVVLLSAGAQHYTDAQTAALEKQEGELKTAKKRYQDSGTEKDTIIEFLPQYQQLIAKGFVGEERRIEWVEALRQQHKAHKLFGIKYAISQQESFQPEFSASIGSFTLHRSIMKLDLDMLHEGDILRLVESLYTPSATPFMLRDCQITRLNDVGPLSTQLVPNMHAACELDWITMREPVLTEVPQ